MHETSHANATGKAADGPQRVKYVRKLDQIGQLSAQERDRLGPVADRYVFRANDYYLDLIDWDDPHDPTASSSSRARRS